MDTLKKSEDLQQKILDLVSEYYVETNKAQEFHKGITPIPMQVEFSTKRICRMELEVF